MGNLGKRSALILGLLVFVQNTYALDTLGNYFRELGRLFGMSKKTDKNFTQNFKTDLWEAAGVYTSGQTFLNPIQSSKTAAERAATDGLSDRTLFASTQVKMCSNVPMSDVFNQPGRNPSQISITQQKVYLKTIMTCLAPHESATSWAENKDFSTRDIKARTKANRSKTVGGVYQLDTNIEHGGMRSCVYNWNHNPDMRKGEAFIYDNKDEAFLKSKRGKKVSLATMLDNPESQRFSAMCGMEKLLYNLRYQQELKMSCVSPFYNGGDRNTFGPFRSTAQSNQIKECMRGILGQRGVASNPDTFEQAVRNLAINPNGTLPKDNSSKRRTAGDAKVDPKIGHTI